MRPIPHNQPSETDRSDDRIRPTRTPEDPETVEDDEMWLTVQEF